MKLISIEDNEIRLNSRLGELAFGKTNFSNIISQEGVIAECCSYEDGKYQFTFSSWNFSDVKAFNIEGRDDRVVFYCGDAEGFLNNAKTLTEFAESENKEEAFEAGFVMCSLFTQAAEENIQLPLNGGGGILINLDKENTKVLFLPAELYKYSVAGLSDKEFAELFGSWVNQTIYDLPALCFARAVIAYKILTGVFPYPNTNQVERNADILDRKFLPLDLSVNGIDKTLAKEVNKALKLNSSAVNVPGKKKKGKNSEDLTPTASFPLDILYSCKTGEYKAKISDEDFKQRAELYLKSQASKVATKRKIRRNITTIVASFIGAIVLAIITGNFISARRSEFYSKGLTSTQTVQTFLFGINDKDSITTSNLVSGKQPQTVTDTISQLYVLGKQRMAYSHDNGYGTIINWMFFVTNPQTAEDAGLYGIAEPKIDGKAVKLENPAFMRKENPEPVTIENGIIIENGAKSVHKAEYILLHTEGEYNDILMENVTQTYTLEYKKDRWIITKIETHNESVDFDSNQFKTAYLDALSANEGDIVKAADSLRFQYFWLPGTKELEAEIQRRIELSANPFLGVEGF